MNTLVLNCCLLSGSATSSVISLVHQWIQSTLRIFFADRKLPDSIGDSWVHFRPEHRRSRALFAPRTDIFAGPGLTMRIGYQSSFE
jgi:hypothetical protein